MAGACSSSSEGMGYNVGSKKLQARLLVHEFEMVRSTTDDAPLPSPRLRFSPSCTKPSTRLDGLVHPKVYAEATLVLPLLVAQTFAKDFHAEKTAQSS